jgi:hypothetical protein
MKKLAILALLTLVVSTKGYAEPTTAMSEKLVTVQRIVLSNVVPVDPTVLKTVLSGYENRPLAFKDLVELEKTLNNVLAQNGQTGVRASIGDIASNTMTIQITNKAGSVSQTDDVAVSPESPSATTEGISALGKADAPVARTSTDSSVPGKAGLVDRYWSRFFQSKPDTNR